MARSFDGSTDRIDWSNIWDPSGLDVTISMWLRWGGDSGHYGYAFNINDSGGNFGFVLGNPNVNSGDVRLYRKTTTGDGVWRTSVGSILVSGTWVHILATSDGGLDPTDIHIYKDGGETSYAATSTDSGESTYSGTWSVGGRTEDDARNFDGDIAELGVWQGIVSADMITALSAGYSPLFFPDNRKAYISLVRDNLERLTGEDGTLDGTTVIDHPPVIYPSLVKFSSLTAAPPVAGSIMNQFQGPNLGADLFNGTLI